MDTAPGASWWLLEPPNLAVDVEGHVVVLPLETSIQFLLG